MALELEGEAVEEEKEEEARQSNRINLREIEEDIVKELDEAWCGV